MKAMILCAGLGTRLKPWTLKHPKALVPLAGVPMLKRVSDRLVDYGFTSQTLNVHHFSSQIIDYIGSGALKSDQVNISDESECLLDTGGGILHAEKYLRDGGTPFLVHNVDILSNADLKALYESHMDMDNDVTLLISDRDSTRKLVFDEDLRLKGWMNISSGESRPDNLKLDASDKVMAFSGIYVMSPQVLEKMRNLGFSGKFPIMEFFLKAFQDMKIRGVCQSNLLLLDIGKPDTLKSAESLLE